MHRLRRALPIILIAAGLVWTGQGIGVIPGSFMTGDPRWAAIGSICLIVGIALAAVELSRRRGRSRV